MGYLHRSTQYIDYEKLKVLLTRAKKSADLREDIIKRMPSELVTNIMEERERIHWSAGVMLGNHSSSKNSIETMAAATTTITFTPVHRSISQQVLKYFHHACKDISHIYLEECW